MPRLLRLLLPKVLEVYVNDSHITGRPKVGKATFALKDLPSDGRLSKWLPLVPINPGQEVRGEVLLDITFKTFEDDDQVRATEPPLGD
jgi:hypothetical protein